MINPEDISIRKQTSSSHSHSLAILVGGGPAPGINGVISAATIEAINHGWKVIGILDGFKWLSAGGDVPVMPLIINDVSRIHTRGGSILRTSRENPTKDSRKIRNVVDSLLKLGIDRLLTIGGDDTAYTSSIIEKETKGRIYVIHVPKTIDNDLPLPGGLSTFGFQTARHFGVEIIKNIMEDAYTTNRWYFVVTMGRKAGHLALGIGKAAGATLTIIAEEFSQETIKMSQISDILEGAIIKRLTMGRQHGVAILAEGLTEKLDLTERDSINVERDEHDHIRLSEIDIGRALKNDVKKRLEARDIKITIVNKDIGYELRCAAPTPFDCDYTRDLGYGAIKLLLDGISGAMVSLQAGRIIPIYFSDIIDQITRRINVRYVDIKTESYAVARSYMIRLKSTDFEDPEELGKLARCAKLTPEEFIKKFGWMRTTRI